jgi:flagellar biosynthesis protein FlhA
MMVTRVSSEEDMGKQVFFQVFNNPKPLLITGGILTFLGLIPGMPHIAFVSLGSVLSYFGYRLIMPTEKTSSQQNEQEEKTEADKKVEDQEITWDDVPPVDTVGLEIGYRLIPLVDQKQSGELMARIKGIRRKLSQELGFLVPSVHIKDNLDLIPNAYRISILGVTVGENKVHPDKNLAINPGQIFGNLEGIETKEPSFGLQAFWIEKTQRQHAQTLGYTVVDASTVVATHLSQIIQTQAHQLVGYKEVQKLLDILAVEVPKLVEGLVPKIMSLGIVVKVVQNLLRENVPIRDMRTIAGTLSEVGQKTQDPIALTEAVRSALGPMIVQQINGFNKELPVMTLDPALEQILQKSIQATEEESLMLEPGLAEKLQKGVKECAERQEVAGLPQVILVSATIRQTLAKFVRSFVPGMAVLSYQEVPEDKHLKIVGTIG